MLLIYRFICEFATGASNLSLCICQFATDASLPIYRFICEYKLMLQFIALFASL
jgi:hypothetical protein